MNMKNKYFKLGIVVIISLIGYFYYQSNNDNKYTKYEQLAQDDIKNNKKKYYHFGFIQMNKQNELFHTLNKNNVQIINMNCAAIPELVHYNDVILNSIK